MDGWHDGWMRQEGIMMPMGNDGGEYSERSEY